MATKRIIDLPVVTSLSEGAYVMLDNASTGTKRYDLKSVDDRVSDVAGDVADVAGDLSGLETTVGGLSTSVGTLTTTVSGLSGTVSGLSATVGGIEGDLSDLSGEVDGKPDADSAAPALTAGAANGVTGGGPTDSSAWLQRACPGTDGPATIGAVHGRTLVWNQLVRDVAARVTSNGVTATRNADGSVTLSGTSTATALVTIVLKNSVCTIIANHRYLLRGGVAGGSSGTYYMNVSGLGPDYGNGSIFSYDSDSDVNLRYTFAPGVTFDNVVCRPQLFDLTRMFGAGNEPTTVAEFEALFPEPYYPYDAGSLLSVSMEGVGTVGFNQWDEQWEAGAIDVNTGGNVASENRIRSKSYIPIFASMEYYAKTPSYIYLFFYDADKNYLGYHGSSKSNSTFVPANLVNSRSGGGSFANAAYMRFRCDTSTYNHDICINVSNPARNGAYEPHWSAQRAIPTATYFPQGMRSAGTVHDELTEGAAVTRVGAVDLGTLTWTEGSNDLGQYFHASDVTDCARPSAASVKPNMTCAKYETVAPNDLHYGSITVTTSGVVYVRDLQSVTYTDAAAFKDAMSGVMLHYALATPTTQAIDPPLNLTYRAAHGGTERIVHESPSAPPTMDVAYGQTAAGIVASALAAIADPDGPTATANHAQGTYLTMGGRLYKVTTAIATGEAIVPGTNVTATTVMAEVLALTQ